MCIFVVGIFFQIVEWFCGDQDDQDKYIYYDYVQIFYRECRWMVDLNYEFEVFVWGEKSR